MNEVLMFAGYAVAAGAFIFAMVTRNQLNNTKLVMAEAANRFELGKKKLSELEFKASRDAEAITKLRANLRDLEKSMDSARNRHAQRAHEIEEIKLKHTEDARKSELKTQHLEEQLRVITEQLAENVKEKKELAVIIDAMKSDISKVSSSKFSSIKDELSQLQEKHKKMLSDYKAKTKEVEKIRSILQKVKPGELKKYKQRATSLDQLYNSMKGLRDMADERSRNWQTALSALSAHITGKKADTYESFGELVGEALEKVGAVLVKDEHTIVGAEIAEPESESAQKELEANLEKASTLENEMIADEQI